MKTGDCDFCRTLNTPVINPREFEEKFIALVEIYEPVIGEIDDDLSPNLIHKKIQEDWSIFNDEIDADTHQLLLKEILSSSFNNDEELFTSPHELRVILHKLEEAESLEKEWESFSNEIKTNNRFFIGESISLELLKDLFRVHTKAYKKGKLFYRGRISTEEGYLKEKIGKPPVGVSKSGRANPVGIPYLYISTEKETVLYETRATHSDFITIAEFRLIDENMKVLRLRKIDDLSPFMAEDGLEKYLKYRKYLKRLEQELSKPLRRHDDEMLDYLPTQYLCEYVKSLGYDAIEYGSSLHDGGINLAVFDDSKLEITDVNVYEVTSVKLDTDPNIEPTSPSRFPKS
ncbi:MAG: RES family NAD+ phosphorylase [Salibacter sp.]|uniref:RES family NAD+ phosphorylase n=1 Tax=Salibacter sp. TaxID=2010995 RepID=UPI002870328A|nr:RES family NAD+ phosphorylase [Salibacter sp.]MDR9399740.1 RES family NAD+ phosphorylase [Salibacter sp.]